MAIVRHSYTDSHQHTRTDAGPDTCPNREQLAAICGKQNGICKMWNSKFPFSSIRRTNERTSTTQTECYLFFFVAFVSLLSFCRDLRFNQFEELPSNAFNGLGQLTTLFLNDNQLAAVEEDAFKGLTALRFLYLNKNALSRLPAGTFQQLPRLEAL